MTDAEILRQVGLGTLLDNVDNNLIGRWVLKAMAKAREDERRGEFICTKCGLRKDSERSAEHEF